MRKRFIAASLVCAGTLGIGYALDQGSAVTLSFAASGTHTHVSGKAIRAQQTSQSGTPHADGTVSAVNGNTITVKADTDPAGSTEYTKVTTIVLTGSTKYDAGNGTTTTTKPTISSGQRIEAEGTVSADGTTLTATVVSVGTHGHGGSGQGGPHADGSVTAVNGNTITVQADNDPAGSTEYTKVTTIVLTSTTQYDNGPGNISTTQPTISTGQYIVADGTLSSDGTTLTATHVSVHASK
ncbi:MAG TPA: DUF5666 domain-containing protein [Chloroflexota bacterium]